MKLDAMRVKVKLPKTEAEVQARLAALKVLLSGAGRDAGDLEKLAASHRELGDKYRSALKSYDSADGKSPQRVDTAVTGIDRAPTKAMDGLVAAIQEMGAQRQVEAGAGAGSWARRLEHQSTGGGTA